VEDLEKELGPIIENFQNLLKDAKAKKIDSLREDEDLKKDFNKLSKDVIEPVMRKFESYLKSKDVNSSVNVRSETVSGNKRMLLNLWWENSRVIWRVKTWTQVWMFDRKLYPEIILVLNSFCISNWHMNLDIRILNSHHPAKKYQFKKTGW